MYLFNNFQLIELEEESEKKCNHNTRKIWHLISNRKRVLNVTTKHVRSPRKHRLALSIALKMDTRNVFINLFNSAQKIRNSIKCSHTKSLDINYSKIINKNDYIHLTKSVLICDNFVFSFNYYVFMCLVITMV